MGLIKKVTVTFDFDPETEKVTNVNCSVDGVEKKKRTSKKDTSDDSMPDVPIITLEETKIVFNKKALFDMEIEAEDRVIIRWEKEDSILYPIIGSDISFDQEGSGNKVTKSGSIAYKGKQNAVLKDFGSEFTIKNYKDGIWKLIPLSDPDKVINVEKKEVVPILVSEEGDNEINIDDELKFEI